LHRSIDHSLMFVYRLHQKSKSSWIINSFMYPLKRNFALQCSQTSLRKGKIWHKHDQTFFRPKVQACFSLLSPICYQSPRSSVLTTLWTNILEDDLNEYSYDASIAGLEFVLHNTPNGCQVIQRIISLCNAN
jgi:secreted Zn-dependent insulinase-like peptidase